MSYDTKIPASSSLRVAVDRLGGASRATVDAQKQGHFCKPFSSPPFLRVQQSPRTVCLMPSKCLRRGWAHLMPAESVSETKHQRRFEHHISVAATKKQNANCETYLDGFSAKAKDKLPRYLGVGLDRKAITGSPEHERTGQHRASP